MSQQAGRPTSSAGGLVGAMVVLVVLVVGYVVLRSVTSNDPAPKVQSVDYAAQVPAAAKQAPFDLQAPARLPTGWARHQCRLHRHARPPTGTSGS